MSQRLTNDMREQIAQSVLRHRFTAEVEALIADRAAFAEDVYNDVYRKADRDKIAALPEGWLPETETICVKFGELSTGYVQLEFTGVFRGSMMSLRKSAPGARPRVWRRVLNKHKGTCWKAYDPAHKLSLRWEGLHSQQTELEERVKAAEKQAEVALGSVTTIGALLKAWPEIEPLVLPHVPVVRSVPALPVGALNAMFKLPVKKAA